MSRSRCKVEIPNQLPASGLTRVQFKAWKEAMIVYLKQNEDFYIFFPGEMYATWTKAEELSNRIVDLHAEDVEANDTNDKRRKRLQKRRTDLHTMLNIIGGKTDQYDFDDVLNLSFSLGSLWILLEQSYDIGRKGVQFLDLHNLSYDKSETPVKFYKKNLSSGQSLQER